MCLCLWLQECVHCDECHLHWNSDQNCYNHHPISFSLPFTISPLVVPEIDLSYILQACYYFSRNHILYPSGNAAVQPALAHTHLATNRNTTINGVLWTVLYVNNFCSLLSSSGSTKIAYSSLEMPKICNIRSILQLHQKLS